MSQLPLIKVKGHRSLCDECRHFPKFNDPFQAICGREHRMGFRMPVTNSDPTWGFYRDNCRSFSRMTQQEAAANWNERQQPKPRLTIETTKYYSQRKGAKP